MDVECILLLLGYAGPGGNGGLWWCILGWAGNGGWGAIPDGAIRYGAW